MATVDLGIIITAINRATAGLNSVGKDVDNLEKKSRSATRSLRALDIVLASIATGSAIAMGKAVLDTASKLEKASIRLAFFEKGFEGGAKAFGELRKQFEGVPMETETMLTGFTKLKAAGIDPLNGSLRTLFDTVSVFGGGSAEFERALNAIVQVSGKGQLMREELQGQLAEAIPFARKLIMDGLGMSSQELNAAMAKGLVGAKDALEAFFREAQKKFGGFGALMAQTIDGGKANVKKAWEDMIKTVFFDSGVSTRIGIFLNGIAQAIQDFAKSITPDQIEAFVELFKDIIRVAAGVAQAIYRVTQVAVGFIATVTDALGAVGADILTTGVIGYMLFGRTKAAFFLGMAIPVIDRLAGGVVGAAVKMGKGVEAVLSIFGTAGAFGVIGGLILGRKGGLLIAAATLIVDSVLTLIRDLIRQVSQVWGLGWLGKYADKFGQSGTSVLSNATKQLEAMFRAGTETPLEKNLEHIFATADGWKAVRDAQNEFMKNAPNMEATLENAQSGTENQAKALEKLLRAQRQAIQHQIDAAKALADMRQISFDTTDVRLAQTTMPFSSSAIDQERQDQRRYMMEALNVKTRILEAQKDMIGATAEQKKVFEAQIVALQNYQGVVEEAARNTTAQAILMRDTWTSVGDAITDSAKRGLSAFAQGTLSVQNLISDLYSTLTDAAAAYLVELVKIQALKAAQGGGFGAGGTGFFGGLMGAVSSFFGGGFANGGVFPSGTTMSSGLLRGPHAFGIGGESGPEAVLPLRRVGGQLGVAAAGGGGNTTIVIQAFDTQAAVDVLMQNSRAMNTALVGNRNLEKSSV